MSLIVSTLQAGEIYYNHALHECRIILSIGEDDLIEWRFPHESESRHYYSEELERWLEDAKKLTRFPTPLEWGLLSGKVSTTCVPQRGYIATTENKFPIFDKWYTDVEDAIAAGKKEQNRVQAQFKGETIF